MSHISDEIIDLIVENRLEELKSIKKKKNMLKVYIMLLHQEIMTLWN